MKTQLLGPTIALLFVSAALAGPHADRPIPRKVVSEVEFNAGLAKLHGKPIGAPITTDGLVCHTLNRIDYWVITGIDSAKGGIWCHFH
jgi:hypothetical protein